MGLKAQLHVTPGQIMCPALPERIRERTPERKVPDPELAGILQARRSSILDWNWSEASPREFIPA